MKLEFYLQGIAVNGPGFASWNDFLALNKENEFLKQKTVLPAAINLPATERRRVTAVIKLALGLADAACEMALSSKDTASFFASSKGDSDIMHYLGQVLATKERLVSPTKFHNSLHNSASGYWSIASHSHAPIQALAAGVVTFQMGLLEAAMYSMAESAPALLVSYDSEPPALLAGLIHSQYSFGSAWFISSALPGVNAQIKTMAKLSLSLVKDAEITVMKCGQLETLRRANCSGASLPLLQAIAEQKNQSIVLPYFGQQQLQIMIEF